MQMLVVLSLKITKITLFPYVTYTQNGYGRFTKAGVNLNCDFSLSFVEYFSGSEETKSY